MINKLNAPLDPADFPDHDAYLQAMRLRYISPMRPTKDQAGHADLPLFQTDLEEFTKC